MENPRKAFAFYGVTLALAVGVAFAVPFLGEASLVVTMMTPTIAAVLMLAFLSPEGGFRKALSLLGLDCAGFKGWPLAGRLPSIWLALPSCQSQVLLFS